MQRDGAPTLSASHTNNCNYFLYYALFVKLRKAIISLVMSVCPPARMEQLGCHWTDFREI